MMIWSGQGYLVAAIVFGVSLLMNMVVDGIYGEGAYSTQPIWFPLALLVAAPFIWVLGTALQKNGDRVVIDKETGEELTINRSSHMFMFVPMKYWAFIATAVAGVLFIKTALAL
ncbi:hypothetical protein [Agrobacterium vaccinii]|uniref:hypothetical protein n=1 Tax=Agrobacterium vaccinii TaxID=2735528 RepID=UPI001E30B7B7|nr:hypothetical protein [Agrobacterium vaccinii]UHS56082.1 hypothetical protein HRS00_04285 [Agrobacterium vaccinii]